MTKLTKEECAIVERWDTMFDVDYLEEWINRDDNVFSNAPSALIAAEARGFYRAVRLQAQFEKEQAK